MAISVFDLFKIGVGPSNSHQGEVGSACAMAAADMHDNYKEPPRGGLAVNAIEC